MIFVRSRLLFLITIGLLVVARTSAQNLVFSKPNPLGTGVNSEAEEINPILSPDGKTLYFVRAFHEENIGGDVGGADIWSSTKSAGKWQPATNQIGKWNNLENNAIIGLNKKEMVVYLANT